MRHVGIKKLNNINAKVPRYDVVWFVDQSGFAKLIGLIFFI